MLRLRRILVNPDPHVPGEGNAGDKVSDQNILLFDEFHVEEVGEGLDIKNSDNVRVNVEEEGERRRNVGAEHGALVLFRSLPEEAFRLLEPEVVQSIGYWPHHRPPVAPRNLPYRQVCRRRRQSRQRRRWRPRRE